MGIWLDESPLKKSIVWENDAHFKNNGKCTAKNVYAVGHNINDEKKRDCFKKITPDLQTPTFL